MTVVAAEELPAIEGTIVPASAAQAAPAEAAAPQQGRSWLLGSPQQQTAPASSPAGPAGPAGQAGAPGMPGMPGRRAAPAPAPVYHRIIIAEFAVAVLLAGASPILRPGGPIGRAKDSTALSLAGPVIRLTAVCVVFFILSLAGTGERSGKIAAAFGGLVVLGMVFNSLPELTTLGLALGGPRKGGSSTNPEVPADGGAMPGDPPA